MRNLFLLSLCLISITSSAMQREESKVIEGDLSIADNLPFYAAGYPWIKILEQRLQIKLEDHDVLIDVHVSSEECEDWQSHAHPKLLENDRFPIFIPFKMLKGKKEGDALSFQMFGKTLILNLRQFKVQSTMSFEAKLEYVKNRISARPNFLSHAKETLLAKEILVRTGEDIYSHGPNGFKDE